MNEKNPFEELEGAIDRCEERSEELEAEESGAKRERSKFYLAEIKFVAQNQRELREYLEENDNMKQDFRIVKGAEIFPKRKTTYTF
jgi:hypothetical protein